jgi:hypothetical protein
LVHVPVWIPTNEWLVSSSRKNPVSERNAGFLAGEVQSHKVAHSRGHGTAVSGFVSIDLDADEPLFEVTEMDEGGASMDVNKSAVRVESSDERCGGE